MRRKTIITIAAAALSFSLGGTALAQFGGSVPGTSSANSRAAVYSKLVNTRLPVDFTNNPLRDVVQFLSEYSQIDILAHWDEQGLGEGLDPSVQINLHLKNPTPLETILDLVLKQATSSETSWNLGDGFIQIGFKETLAKDKYIRIYPVRELIFSVPTFTNAPEMDLDAVMSGGDTGEISGSLFQNTNSSSQSTTGANGQLPSLADADQPKADELINILTSIVDPLQWEKNGGEGGSMRYFNGTLIVNAADFLHRQLAGYPFSAAVNHQNNTRTASLQRTPRYVNLTGRFGFSKITNIEQSEIPILVGNRVITSGGGG